MLQEGRLGLAAQPAAWDGQPLTLGFRAFRQRECNLSRTGSDHGCTGMIGGGERARRSPAPVHSAERTTDNHSLKHRYVPSWATQAIVIPLPNCYQNRCGI